MQVNSIIYTSYNVWTLVDIAGVVKYSLHLFKETLEFVNVHWFKSNNHLMFEEQAGLNQRTADRTRLEFNMNSHLVEWFSGAWQ